MKEKLKPYKTVEQIAKKHRMDVSDIQKQLDMGAPIEHEHTKNQKLAVEIALQHLDEFPDYYTRLKKMEASAKKEHKKFKDVVEAKKMKGEDPCWKGYEMIGKKKKGGKEVPNCVPVEEQMGMRYCPKCEKDETREECRYGPKYWDMFSIPSSLSQNQIKFSIAQVHPANESKEPDHEYSMARSELSTIISAAKRLRGKLNGEGNIEAWVQSKITKAADYLDSAADYVDSGEMQKEQISFEVGHTSKDTRNALRQDKIRKLASQGSTEGERNAAKGKLSGIQLPLANSTDLKTFGQFMSEASPAWQRKEGKNSEGGLNKKGVESYRRENPGSKLQTAVTTDPSKLKKGSKASNRRKSFCARMSGMKKKLTSAKTANDPNSRINKSLRAWNC